MCGWQVEETLSKIAANMHSWKELKGASSPAHVQTPPPPSRPSSLRHNLLSVTTEHPYSAKTCRLLGCRGRRAQGRMWE